MENNEVQYITINIIRVFLNFRKPLSEIVKWTMDFILALLEKIKTKYNIKYTQL